MTRVPLVYAFDSPRSFAAWLATVLPRDRHEVTAEGVRVRRGVLTGVLVRPAGSHVTLEPVIPVRAAKMVLAFVTLCTLAIALNVFTEALEHFTPSHAPPTRDADQYALGWWAQTTLGFTLAAMFPLWLVRAARHRGQRELMHALTVVCAGYAVSPKAPPRARAATIATSVVGVTLGVMVFATAYVPYAVSLDRQRDLWHEADVSDEITLTLVRGVCTSSDGSDDLSSDAYRACRDAFDARMRANREARDAAARDVGTYWTWAVIVAAVGLLILAWGAGSTLVGILLAPTVAVLAALFVNGLMFDPPDRGATRHAAQVQRPTAPSAVPGDVPASP